MELSSDGRSSDGVISLRYGLESLGSYTHSSKHCNIVSVTFNSKTSQYIILDSRGITGWFRNSTLNYTTRLHDFGSYKFNLLRDIIYCRSANVYFALSKDFGVKVYNLNFIEIFSIATDGTTISRLLFDGKRSELIMISRNRFQFWKFMIVEKSRACDGLKLLREYNTPEGALVTNAEYDSDSERLYLVCDHDIWCYDVFGQCVAHFVHSRFVLSTLTVCAFCKEANVLVAGCSTGEISIYSLNGGLITTLLNHTRSVTALITHPSDSTLFLSSSMDGTIKIFSLQMFEEIYNINVFSEGIYWMKLRSASTLYCASTTTVTLFDLNHVCSFWGTVRSPVKSINMVPKYAHKTSHILVYGQDKCIRIFSRKSGLKKCTVLPPPEYFSYKDNISFSYDRVGNIIYILFNEEQLWIYLTRTDPATRVAVWSISEIVKLHSDSSVRFVGCSSSEMLAAKEFGSGSYNERKQEEEVRCLCTETIPRDLYQQRLQLDSSHNFSLLLCGMSNGTVYFLDPSPPVSVVLGFRAHPTSPVMNIKTVHQGSQTLIMTVIETISETLLKIWCHETFDLVHALIVGSDVSVYSLKFSIFVSGSLLGQLRIERLEGIQTELPENETTKSNTDHNGPIVDVDVLEHRKIICSCSTDQYVRLWNYQKDLLMEINFDETLCCSAFLCSNGSLLIGLKSHLFTVSSELLKFQNDSDDGISSESDESGAESVVYEDPLVRQDIGKNMEFKTRNLDNYLIPYPYLFLESKWMDQCAISDNIEVSDEDRSSTPSSCGSSSTELYAPTEVYADSSCSEILKLDFEIEMPRCDADSPGFDDDSRCGSCNELWSELETEVPVENVKAKEPESKKIDKKPVESKPKPKPIDKSVASSPVQKKKPEKSVPSGKPEVKKTERLPQSQTGNRSMKGRNPSERKKESRIADRRTSLPKTPSPQKLKVTKKANSSVTKSSPKVMRKQKKSGVKSSAARADASPKRRPMQFQSSATNVKKEKGTTTPVKVESPVLCTPTIDVSESPVAQSDLLAVHSLGRMPGVVSNLGVSLNEAKSKQRFHSTSYKTVLNSLVNAKGSSEEHVVEEESIIGTVSPSTEISLDQVAANISSLEPNRSSADASGDAYQDGNDVELQRNVCFVSDADFGSLSLPPEHTQDDPQVSGSDHVMKKRRKSVQEARQHRANMSDWEKSRIAVMAVKKLKRKFEKRNSTATDLIEDTNKSIDSSPMAGGVNSAGADLEDELDIKKNDERKLAACIERMMKKDERPAYLLAGKVKPIINAKRWAKTSKTNLTQSNKNTESAYLVKLLRSLRMSAVSHKSDESEATLSDDDDDDDGNENDVDKNEKDLDIGVARSIMEVPGNQPVTSVRIEEHNKKTNDDNNRACSQLSIPDQLHVSSLMTEERSDVSFVLGREMSSCMERSRSTLVDDLVCTTPDTVADYSTRSSPLSNMKDEINDPKHVGKPRKIAFDESHITDQRIHSRMSSGYGTKSPCSATNYYERDEPRPKSYDEMCSRLKQKERLSVADYPVLTEYRSCPHHAHIIVPSGKAAKPPKESEMPSKAEKRLEQIKKLEHKMSGQPYRLHRVKSSSDYQDEMTKLMFLKSADVGREFLRNSKRRVISIPSKNDYPAAYRERIEEYSY